MTRTCKLLVSFATASLVACAPARPPDPPKASRNATPATLQDAVLPYSYELERAQPVPRPFMARFEKDDRSLFFVAAEHGCDPRTFRLIDDALATDRVRLVVIEGFPAAQGVNPPEYSRLLAEWAENGFCKGGGEPGYAAFRARDRGLSYVGGEPDEHAIVDAAIARGYTAEDLLGFYFVRQVPQFRRDGTLEAKGLDACFRLLVGAMAKSTGLVEESARFTLDRFLEWYRAKQGKVFDVAAMDDEEPAPVASGTYFTQRVSSVVGLVRDRLIVERIASLLASEKQVLVVYGGSHFATIRPALELLMGKPREMKAGSR